jgi:hypothetical protein
MALGEALAVRAEDGGKMSKLRNRPTEGFVDGYLLGSVGDVVIAADDVSDAHKGVVDGDHVVIDRNAVAFNG